MRRSACMQFVFRPRYRDAAIGVRVVRVLALIVVALAIVGGTRNHGAGAYLCWFGASFFLLTAALPRSFGKIAGSVIAIVSALILFLGPHGEPAITALGVLFAIPPMLVAGLLVNPGIVDAVWALFRA